MTVKSFDVRNVNHALPEMLWWLKAAGIQEGSRNGPVLVAPGPVIVSYRYPWERVLFSKDRDANPFFHFMEALWMLDGRRDVAWIQQFNSRMGGFSDDKTSLWGAYGYRWRSFFVHDQIQAVITHLRAWPDSRRAVLTMWSPNGDLWTMRSDWREELDGQGGPRSRDVPCNTHAYLAIHDGHLDLTVCNRSNDAIWGAFGANAVHMSFLHEYVARHLSLTIGTYHQFSNNMHLYPECYGKDIAERMAVEVDDRYSTGIAAAHPLILANQETMEDWDRDLRQFIDMADPTRDPTVDRRFGFYTDFFAYTAAPMLRSWQERKRDETDGLEQATHIQAPDWRLACAEWIIRREDARRDAEAA